MSTNIISTAPLLEAKRQIEICNACRYCEGFCSAFPAITRLREFDNADITQIASTVLGALGIEAADGMHSGLAIFAP